MKLKKGQIELDKLVLAASQHYEASSTSRHPAPSSTHFGTPRDVEDIKKERVQKKMQANTVWAYQGISQTVLFVVLLPLVCMMLKSMWQLSWNELAIAPQLVSERTRGKVTSVRRRSRWITRLEQRIWIQLLLTLPLPLHVYQEWTLEMLLTLPLISALASDALTLFCKLLLTRFLE